MLSAHPGLLVPLLDALAGATALNGQARACLRLDPALALDCLRIWAQQHPGTESSQIKLDEVHSQISIATLKGLVSNAAIRHLAEIRTVYPEEAWQRALGLAHLCQILAQKAGYPATDEAWLAGLFCSLPNIPALLAELPLRGFLADAPRYLREPTERLRDATFLPRLAAAAWRMLESRGTLAADAVSSLVLLDPETLKAMLQDMDKSVETFMAQARAPSTQELASALARFTQAELATSELHERPDDCVVTAARLLAEQDGLFDPLYLRLDKRTSMLEAQDLGETPAPALSIRVEGSNTAAVRALYTRTPVVVYTATDSQASLLDIQLARQADADGIAAIPVGNGTTRGVLLVCGDRDALAAIETHGERYLHLGERVARVSEKNERMVSEADPYLSGRVRRAAHEINNPLGIIKNYLAILKAKLGDDAPIVDELRIIHEELDRIVRIVRALAQNDDSLAELAEDTDIGQLAQDMIKVTAPTWQPRGIRVTHKPSPGLPRLKCDRDKLKQILLNLLLNALEATPNDGEVRLETAQVTNHKRERFVELQVADSGPGINPELADRLFDPVETDKGNGHAGLGLSIVKTLAEDLGGTISFKSGSAGTTFQILFPLA